MSQQEVQDWIGKQIAANDVVLFMKGTREMPQCGFSMQVAQILNHLGVDFKDINVLEDMGVREGMVADLNVFDPESVAPAMPELVHDLPGGAPRLSQRSVGFLATLVAGEVLVDRGEATEARAGRLLRGPLARSR